MGKGNLCEYAGGIPKEEERRMKEQQAQRELKYKHTNL